MYKRQAYDSEGMLMEVTDHVGRKVKLEYDGGMLKTVTTPSGAVYTYSYGDNGRITETVNARNVTAVRLSLIHIYTLSDMKGRKSSIDTKENNAAQKAGGR